MTRDAISLKRGAVVLPRGAVASPRGAVFSPRGAVALPRGAVFSPRGAVFSPRGAVALPRGAVFSPRGAVALPRSGALNTAALFVGVLLCAAQVVGCDDAANKPAVTRDRNQVVLAKGSSSAGALSAASSRAVLGQAGTRSGAPKPTKAANKPRKKLCGGELKPGYALPETKLPVVGRGVGQALVPGGKWVWLNFWAAWCEPCKEEIPRLLAWQTRLQQSGVPFTLSFITLDDDQRQLDAFLASQPESGLRHSFWLKEGAPRETWLKAAKLDPDPNLPFHVLLDPKGEVRCVIDGAVEDADYADLAALLRMH